MIAPSHHRAEHRTGPGQLSEVRLRLCAHIDAQLHARSTTTNVLAQMAGANWVARLR